MALTETITSDRKVSGDTVLASFETQVAGTDNFNIYLRVSYFKKQPNKVLET